MQILPLTDIYWLSYRQCRA